MSLMPQMKHCPRCDELIPADFFGMHVCEVKPMTAKPEPTDVFKCQNCGNIKTTFTFDEKTNACDACGAKWSSRTVEPTDEELAAEFMGWASTAFMHESISCRMIREIEAKLAEDGLGYEYSARLLLLTTFPMIANHEWNLPWSADQIVNCLLRAKDPERLRVIGAMLRQRQV